jgi:hypothetical protein
VFWLSTLHTVAIWSISLIFVSSRAKLRHLRSLLRVNYVIFSMAYFRGTASIPHNSSSLTPNLSCLGSLLVLSYSVSWHWRLAVRAVLTGELGRHRLFAQDKRLLAVLESCSWMCENQAVGGQEDKAENIQLVPTRSRTWHRKRDLHRFEYDEQCFITESLRVR